MDSVRTRIWESLRVDAKQADLQLDQQLSDLEDLAKIDESNVQVASPSLARSSKASHHGVSSAHRSPAAASHALPMLHDVQTRFDNGVHNAEAILRHFDQILLSMTDASQDSAASLRHTERYQGIVHEKRRTLQRVISDFRRRRELLELLPTVAVELKQYEEDAGARVLMEEQDSIRHAHSRVGHILEEAGMTHSRLLGQRERFTSMADRLVQIAERVPVIQGVLKRIDARRRREVVILGSLLSVLLFLTLIFW